MEMHWVRRASCVPSRLLFAQPIRIIQSFERVSELCAYREQTLQNVQKGVEFGQRHRPRNLRYR